MKRFHHILVSIILLFAGAVVYLFYNQNAHIIRAIPAFMKPQPVHIQISLIDDFMHCYCADLLWAMSFTFLLQSIFMLKGNRIFLLIASALLGIVTEFLQLFSVFNGVFDVYDIIVYIIGAVVATFIIRRKQS